MIAKRIQDFQARLTSTEKISHFSTLSSFNYKAGIGACAITLIIGFLANLVWLLTIGIGLFTLKEFIRFKTTYFVITNRRVCALFGVLDATEVEIMLNKIETISIRQAFGDADLKSGTVIIVGSGGTKKVFNDIYDPFLFRDELQKQLEVIQGQNLLATQTIK